MSSPREEEAGRTESRFLLFGPTGEGLLSFREERAAAQQRPG